MPSSLPQAQTVTLHGNEVSYRTAGSGPVLLLLHGITSSNETWREVIGPLSAEHTVVAPDLLGHGTSAKPRGDYSLGAHASGVRDLLAVLGHDRCTVVGHSLGGGIALQFAYQFPERTERLALIDSGGLGRSVNPVLRAAALPGADIFLSLLAGQWAHDAAQLTARLASRIGIDFGADLAEGARGYASLGDVESRHAFLHTLRAVIDTGGQRVSASDRLYLATDLPFLIVWGVNDHIIPVEHGRRAHKAIPGSRLVEIEGAGHFPQLDQPDRVARALLDFMAETEPAILDEETLRGRLRSGAAPVVKAARAKSRPRAARPAAKAPPGAARGRARAGGGGSRA